MSMGRDKEGIMVGRKININYYEDYGVGVREL
jgi:hypothetical protein